jgi:hypothetical protein
MTHPDDTQDSPTRGELADRDDHLSPALEAWVTRFAAGAGTLFEWRLWGASIIALLPCYGFPAYTKGMCPLSAEHTLETGEECLAHDYRHAGMCQDLEEIDFQRIAKAADFSLQSQLLDQEERCLRVRLLRICRLEEPTP